MHKDSKYSTSLIHYPCVQLSYLISHDMVYMDNVTFYPQIPYNSENKPWAYFRSDTLFGGLIFGGAYFRGCLYTEVKIVQEPIFPSVLTGFL